MEHQSTSLTQEPGPLSPPLSSPKGSTTTSFSPRRRRQTSIPRSPPYGIPYSSSWLVNDDGSTTQLDSSLVLCNSSSHGSLSSSIITTDQSLAMDIGVTQPTSHTPADLLWYARDSQSSKSPQGHPQSPHRSVQPLTFHPAQSHVAGQSSHSRPIKESALSLDSTDLQDMLAGDEGEARGRVIRRSQLLKKTGNGFLIHPAHHPSCQQPRSPLLRLSQPTTKAPAIYHHLGMTSSRVALSPCHSTRESACPAYRLIASPPASRN